jgi:hypothetical protein
LAAAAGQDSEEQALLGSGAHVYRWVPDWLQVPGGGELGNTHGDLIVDADGQLYVNTDTERAVMVFAPDGSFVRSFGADLAGGLHGMALVSEGEREVLWLAHTARHEVLKTTLEGEVLQTIGWPEASGLYEHKGKYRPTGVAIAPDGTVFVGDGYGASWIHRFGADGTYQKSFGGPGTDPGELRTPHGVWIDTRGDEPNLVVADRENGRLQRFSLEGEPLSVFEVELRRPCGVKEQDGFLLVPDLAGRVTIVGPAGELVCHLGDNPDPAKRANHGVPRIEWRDGEFTAPHSATWDAAGNLFVMDWNAAGRVSKLERVR